MRGELDRARARAAASLIRRHLAEDALDGLAARLDSVATHPKLTRDRVLESLGVADIAVLRLEAAAAAGIVEACRTSIAPRIIAHEESARRKHHDLTVAADAIATVLTDATPDSGASV